MTSTNVINQTKFPLPKYLIAGWGLKDTNLTFIRLQIRSCILEYVNLGDAYVEYTYC